MENKIAPQGKNLGDRKVSLIKKLLILAMILFWSSIPRWLTEFSILEGRKRYHAEAVESVIRGWAATHRQIGRAEIHIPQLFEMSNPSKYDQKSVREASRILLPSSRKMKVESKHEFRKRGIFSVPVYTAEVDMIVDFDLADALRHRQTLNGQGVPGKLSPILSESQLFIPIQFTYGLNEYKVELLATEEKSELKALRSSDGIRVSLADVLEKSPQPNLRFQITETLKGYNSIAFDISGGKTDLEVKSDWKTPSFQGQLPQNYTLHKAGFDAAWTFFDPGHGQEVLIEFYESVSLYRQSERAMKYGFLISLVCLTLFFLFEVLQGLKLHAMHYLLLSLPISIFFILLIALSEQIGFTPAYTVACLSILGLMTSYMKGIGANRQQCALFAGVAGSSYGVIYVLLLSSDYALLLGSIALFALLAVVMKATQRVNWQEIGS